MKQVFVGYDEQGSRWSVRVSQLVLSMVLLLYVVEYVCIVEMMMMVRYHTCFMSWFSCQHKLNDVSAILVRRTFHLKKSSQVRLCCRRHSCETHSSRLVSSWNCAMC